MAPSKVSQVWVLRVGEQHVALTPRELKEVLEITQLTPVPLAPPMLLGLLSNQGKVIPLVDMGQMLGQASHAYFQAAVVQHNDQVVALAINEVVGISPWHVETFGQNMPGKYGLETALLAGKTVVRLDLETLMQSLRGQVQAIAGVG